MKPVCLGLLLIAGCGPSFTSPPANPPKIETPVGDERLMLEQDQNSVRVEQNPYARRPSRRADYDVNATLIAENVALVMEPAIDAPIYVSNLLGAALARRFAGQLPLREALGAAEVFLAQPIVSSEATSSDGTVVVDWLIRTERGLNVGAAYAARRLSGTISGGSFWEAFTADDAEFIALQTAAQILNVGPIRDALLNAAIRSEVDAIPAPASRPDRPVDGFANGTARVKASAPVLPVPRPRR